jgi:protein involved in polysaccharide export with SLBB domain
MVAPLAAVLTNMQFRCLAALLFLLAGCGPTTRTVLEKSPTIPMADTTLGVGDTFEVRVYGENDLSGMYRVGAEGTITFPLAGVIEVQGLDPQAIAKRIADRLRDGILRSPQVTVLVKEQNSKKIYIMGQVAKPGTIIYTPSMSVVEAITLSGGFTPLAAKNDTTVTRYDAGSKSIVKCPVDDISQGKAQNIYLRPGDIISVPERLF